MKFLLPIQIPLLQTPLSIPQRIYLTGSCFTEHMSGYLRKAKFRVKENSHGIMFNPMSVSRALKEVVEHKIYSEADLFLLDEYYHSWQHHSSFSHLEPELSLGSINACIREHHHFLKEADHIIITLGSAYAYRHLESGVLVGNNHRAPAAWFQKELLQAGEICVELEDLHQKLRAFNPGLKILYTVSPVRHTRDGVIENNLGKAQLLTAVHALKDIYYFPSYEIVIDVLRDYRFYDADLVHPNYAATRYIWEQFVSHCISADDAGLLAELEQLSRAMLHRPKSTESLAHRRFLGEHLLKCEQLLERCPLLDLREELHYFRGDAAH